MRSLIPKYTWDKIMNRAGYRCELPDHRGPKNGVKNIVHHINGMRNDNREDNLIVLCSNCHTFIHWNGNYQRLPRWYNKNHQWIKGCYKEMMMKNIILFIHCILRFLYFSITGIFTNFYYVLKSEKEYYNFHKAKMSDYSNK